MKASRKIALGPHGTVEVLVGMALYGVLVAAARTGVEAATGYVAAY